MTNLQSTQIYQSWTLLLREVELSKNYKKPFELYGLTPNTPNMVPDKLLPTLLYIKLVTILDDAFVFHIDNNLQMPSNFKQDLNGRINFLDLKGLLVNAVDLHKIREKRNKLSHELKERLSWNEFDQALNVIEKEFQKLNFVGIRPKYEFYAGKSGMKESKDPGVIGVVNYHYGVKSEEEDWTQSWSERILDD